MTTEDKINKVQTVPARLYIPDRALYYQFMDAAKRQGQTTQEGALVALKLYVDCKNAITGPYQTSEEVAQEALRLYKEKYGKLT